MKITKTEEKIDLENKKSILKEIDKKISKKVFINLLIAIAIMAYFCVLSVVYNNIYIDGIVEVIQVTTLVILAITILLIELAYKKESKTLFIHVVEILMLAIHSLTTMHIIKIYNIDFKSYILTSSYVFSIYYVLKTILINTKARRDYLKNMSDIPEIIKKEEPSKKEATKKENKQQIEEVNTTQNKEQKEVETQEEQETTVQAKEEISTSEKIANLKSKMEKLIEKEKNIKSKIKKEPENKKEEKPQESVEENQLKEEIKQQEENKEVEEAPKPKRKRGRPKKEVKVND